MKINAIEKIYSSSIIVFHSILKAMKDMKGTYSPVFATDFCHQTVQDGGFGSLWAMVAADPDSIYSLFISFHTFYFKISYG